jgi:hypothetical protein
MERWSNVVWAIYCRLLKHIAAKRKNAADWTPETLSSDSELVDGLRHFFSDYQHITREYQMLNQQIDRLDNSFFPSFSP